MMINDWELGTIHRYLYFLTPRGPYLSDLMLWISINALATFLQYCKGPKLRKYAVATLENISDAILIPVMPLSPCLSLFSPKLFPFLLNSFWIGKKSTSAAGIKPIESLPKWIYLQMHKMDIWPMTCISLSNILNKQSFLLGIQKIQVKLEKLENRAKVNLFS